jgi:prevent-host-death family protein
MLEVTVTTFRKHIPDYLGKVRKGEDIFLTSRGKVIARLVPPTDARLSARDQLAVLRGVCNIGDVLTPIDEEWEANRADT